LPPRQLHIGRKEAVMLTIELEQEGHGRWIAEVTALRGVLAHGATKDEARARASALAFRVIADLIEVGESIPEQVRGIFAPA
jgi:predicted RNase H-like HicB family nuclease